MMLPSKSTVRRSCTVKDIDPETGWAVVVGPVDHPNLFGVRATEVEADILAKRVRRMGSIPQVSTVAELLKENA